MGCIRSSITIVCCEVTPCICEFEAFIAQNECSHFLKNSTQVTIAKIILYPPTDLETSIQLWKNWASDSELKTTLVSQSKLSKELEERIEINEWGFKTF